MSKNPTGGDNDYLLIGLYQSAINRRIAQRILEMETPPTPLDAWMAKAAALDQNWRQSEILTGRIKSTPVLEWFGRGAPSSSSKAAKDPFAMDVDALTLSERETLQREKRCFYCKEIGHMANNCNKKGRNNYSNFRGNQGV